MTDHAEEQEMEVEALTAIFDTHFEILKETQPFEWCIEIYPENGDPSELNELNHVACKLLASIPLDYPESLPKLDIEIVKGLADEHRQELKELADEEATANEGAPSIFAIAEKLREWLLENNVKGLDDVSMHAQMMRKQKEEAKAQIRATAAFETQKQNEDVTEAEAEESAVRKRRAEGTPCTLENFLAWQERFDQEMAERAAEEDDEDGKGGRKKDKVKTVDKGGRITGFDFFSNKGNNLEALEAAAEAAGNAPLDVDEELFDVDDEDLDDLDFDDDEDEELDI